VPVLAIRHGGFSAAHTIAPARWRPAENCHMLGVLPRSPPPAPPERIPTILATSSASDGDDKLAIAQEVIVSAGNILAAAGFRRDEIAAFFRQAADQLASVAPSAPPVRAASSAPPATEAPPLRSIAEMQAAFAEIPPVRALAGMAVDPQVIAGLRDGSEPASPHIDHALQMLPQVAEAQNWLRDTAMAAGLTFAADRRCLRDEAGAEPVIAADDTLFFDDFEAAYKPCLDFVTALAAAVVCENDEQALNLLLRGLVSCGVIPSYELKNQMVASVEQLVPRTAEAN